MKLNESTANLLASRWVFFIEDGIPYTLVEADKSFFFACAFIPSKHKYKGKKRDIVVAAAMRDHSVYGIETVEQFGKVLKEAVPV